jgi:hypothetical protein
MPKKLYVVEIAAINRHSKRHELTVCTAEVEPNKEDNLDDKLIKLALIIYPLNKYSERQIKTKIVEQEIIARCL